MLYYNIKLINYEINKKLWHMIIKLTFVYWSLYKILKEYSWNIFLKIYFLNINYNKLEFVVALLQAYVFTVQFKFKNKSNK